MSAHSGSSPNIPFTRRGRTRLVEPLKSKHHVLRPQNDTLNRPFLQVLLRPRRLDGKQGRREATRNHIHNLTPCNDALLYILG